jgi:5-methylcytosine-specific restriction endonuclease McrA
MEPQPFLVEVSEEQIRRERHKARELRASQWWKRKRGAGICHHCRGKFPPTELTMDHLVPVIRGGQSTKGNLVPSCKACNNARKHRLPFEKTGG